MLKSKRAKKVLIILTSIILILAVGLGIVFGVMTYQLNQIPNMSFTEMLHYTTQNNQEAVITVGIIQNDEVSYQVYGKDGATSIEQKEHTYEIGSITKTVTATMIYKAIDEGKLNLEDRIDKYLTLPKKEYYPTIKALLTHTSGYSSHYFESEMVSNFFAGRNDFYGISNEKVLTRIGKINLKEKEYSYQYSNFGYAVLGLLLSKVYDKEYRELADRFLKDELELRNTKITDCQGDLGKNWDWRENDAYLSAGGVTSNIGDMLKYANLQLKSSFSYLSKTHHQLSDKSGNTEQNEKMNIHVDYMCAAWVGDNKNEILWHNGGTGNYNSYIGFDKKNQIAVVILSNLSPSYRIPATVMGIKLLTDLQRQSETFNTKIL